MASLKPTQRNLSPRLEGEVESVGSDHCWILPLSHSCNFQCWLRNGKEIGEKKIRCYCSTVILRYHRLPENPLCSVKLFKKRELCCASMVQKQSQLEGLVLPNWFQGLLTCFIS